MKYNDKAHEGGDLSPISTLKLATFNVLPVYYICININGRKI